MASSSDCSFRGMVVTNADAWPASARKRDKDRAAEVQTTRMASMAEGGEDLPTAEEEEDGGREKGGRRKRGRLEGGVREDGLGVGRGEGERRKEVVSAAIAIGHRLSSSLLWFCIFLFYYYYFCDGKALQLQKKRRSRESVTMQ